jgi:hypothetical protein
MDQTFILPRLMNRERQVERIAAVLKGLPQDKAWRVEVHTHQRRRSDQQNRYLWGVVYGEILKHLQGWDKDDVHEYFLGECFGWEIVEGFGAKRKKPVRRSSKLSKLEFGDYVAFIQRKCAEIGLYIPDPNEMEAAA